MVCWTRCARKFAPIRPHEEAEAAAVAAVQARIGFWDGVLAALRKN